MQSFEQLRVWDLLVRVFHWSVVGAVVAAWVTDDHFLILHVWAGYTIVGLVLFRLFWGLVGTRHARFSAFVRRPATVIAYIKDVVAFRAKRHIGHNPAGGAMVIALLLSLAATTLTGLAVYGAEEFSGPLAPLFLNLPHFWGELLGEVHEFFVNITLLLVFLHLAGVFMASVQHKENLVRSMITGIKQKEVDEHGK
ncbi:MAG: cytochrome b/b6 domain-containing protein [Sedimenticola sp.]